MVATSAAVDLIAFLKPFMSVTFSYTIAGFDGAISSDSRYESSLLSLSSICSTKFIPSFVFGDCLPLPRDFCLLDDLGDCKIWTSETIVKFALLSLQNKVKIPMRVISPSMVETIMTQKRKD